MAVFKCDLLPLTARGVSREELQGVIDYIVGLLKKCPQLKVMSEHKAVERRDGHGARRGREVVARGAGRVLNRHRPWPCRLEFRLAFPFCSFRSIVFIMGAALVAAPWSVGPSMWT